MAQTDSLTHSFEKVYKKSNPTLRYTYDGVKRIHNYSNNWDLDNDGINDHVFFVGTGSVHTYYFLTVVLSSDKMVRDYPFLQSDFPILPAETEAARTDFDPINNHIYIAVRDFDKDGTKDIFIRLDDASFHINKKILKRQGVKTKYIILMFKKNNAILSDFEYGR